MFPRNILPKQISLLKPAPHPTFKISSSGEIPYAPPIFETAAAALISPTPVIYNEKLMVGSNRTRLLKELER